jgi:hypothetical protein
MDFHWDIPEFPVNRFFSIHVGFLRFIELYVDIQLGLSNLILPLRKSTIFLLGAFNSRIHYSNKIVQAYSYPEMIRGIRV